MSDINNGGPAFPHKPSQVRPAGVGDWQIVTEGDAPGMTLRDYFAAKAMQVHGYGLRGAAANGPEDWDAMVAERAYMTADAMLKARGGVA